MAIARNLNDGVLKVKDGSATPKSLTVALDQGELKWERKTAVQPIYDRKTIKGQRRGRDQIVDISFRVAYDFIAGDTSGTTPSLSEVLHGDGLAATLGWTSKDKTNSDYVVDLEFTITAPSGSGEKNEVITFSKFAVTGYAPAEAEHVSMIEVKGQATAISIVRS